MIPYNEAFHKTRTGPLLAADYLEAGRHIGDDDQWVVWPARIERDVCEQGLSYDASLAKHRREWRQALGLPLPQPPTLPFKGAFVIPNALPDIPWGDHARIWTPAFTCYRGTDWQKRILDLYCVRGYTHFVYNVARPYHTDYPEPDPLDDPARVRADLTLIRSFGLVPVVAACDDQNGGSVTPWRAFVENVDLVPVAFPMWEMNGPLGIATYNGDGTFSGRIVDCIRNSTSVAPDTWWFLHFTAGHGSIGSPEREGWAYVKTLGIRGLFSQDAGYDRDAHTGDPEGTAAGLLDTKQRLATLGLLNVAFEQSTTPVYHGWTGWDEAHQRAYGAQLQQLAPGLAGYMDGGF